MFLELNVMVAWDNEELEIEFDANKTTKELKLYLVDLLHIPADMNFIIVKKVNTKEKVNNLFLSPISSTVICFCSYSKFKTMITKRFLYTLLIIMQVLPS